MSKISMSDVLSLPIDERIALVQDIWDSISEVPESVTVPESHRAELDRRFDAWNRGDETFSPWEEVKERLLKRL